MMGELNDHVPAAAWADVHARFRLRAGVSTAENEQGERYLLNRRAASSIGRLDGGQQQALQLLAAGEPVDAAELSQAAGSAAAAQQLLAQLHRGGWLVVDVAAEDSGEPLYTVHPHRRPPPAPGPPTAGAALSRLTVVYRDGADFVLESPRSWCTLRVHDTTLLGTLDRGGPAAAPAAVAARLWRDLWHADMVVDPRAEESEQRYRQWSPAELWCHWRSRLGYHQEYYAGVGATWWSRGVFDPLPARPDPWPGPVLDLPRPDPEELSARDPSLVTVVEECAPSYTHDDEHPITAAQLAELLHRCARVRRTFTSNGVELQDRPYLTTGYLHELELYPVVRHVGGLDPGMYHYDGFAHRLERVCPPDHPGARGIIAQPELSPPPQLVLVVAARWGRVLQKYERTAHAMVQRHAGMLCQLLGMTATAMGLSASALTSGDVDRFAEATGLDPLVEGSVLELVIGSRPAVPEPPPWEIV